MLNASDIVAIKAQDDWIREACEYAELTWSFTFNRMGKANPYDRIKKIVIGLVAQSAYEEWLKQNKIPYDQLGRTPWYEIDRYDIGIYGRKNDIKAFFLDITNPILQNRGIKRLSPQRTDWLLTCSALVPQDQYHSRSLEDKDIYVFAFIADKFYYGFLPLFDKELNRWIVHAFWDYHWLKPSSWVRTHGEEMLGRISVKALDPKDEGKTITIGGTVAPQQKGTEVLTLKAGQWVSTKASFYQLVFLRIDKKPNGEIIIQASQGGLKERIPPVSGFEIERGTGQLKVRLNGWNDIWLYNPIIYLVGFLTKAEFGSIAEAIDRFDKTVKQYLDTLTPNYRCYVYNLRPLKDIKTLFLP